MNARQLFLPQMKEDRAWFPLAALTVSGIAVTNTVLLHLLSQPIDLIIQQNFSALTNVLLWLVMWVVINQLFHFSASLLTSRLGLKFVGRVRQRVVSHLLSISWPAASRFSQGNVLACLTNDTDEVQRLLVESPFYLFSHICIISFYLLMLFWLDAQLALIALVVTPAFLIHQRLFVLPRRRAAQGFMASNGLLLEFEQGLIRFVKNIAGLGASERLANKHASVFEKAMFWAMKERWLEALFRTSLQVLVYLAAIFVLYKGIEDVQSGVLTVGELVSFLLFLGYLSVPLKEGVQLLFQAQAGFAAVNRIEQILATEPQVKDPPHPLQWSDNPDGVHIQAQDLSFAYAGQKPLFQQVEIDIPAGETIAVVGRSGVGKSSFVNLLMRFVEPDHGQLLLNGVDVTALSSVQLRKHIAVVWQQPVILPGSIRENMHMAAPQASDEMLMNAFDQVGLADWLAQWPQGLDTQLGQQGAELSGGQLQRLAIAQALLQDTPLIILDEPTSALDSQAEQDIVNLLEQIKAGRTILMIGHRFSSLRHLDRVMFFDGETIVLDRHEALLEQETEYRNAIRWQTRLNK